MSDSRQSETTPSDARESGSDSDDVGPIADLGARIGIRIAGGAALLAPIGLVAAYLEMQTLGYGAIVVSVIGCMTGLLLSMAAGLQYSNPFE